MHEYNRYTTDNSQYLSHSVTKSSDHSTNNATLQNTRVVESCEGNPTKKQLSQGRIQEKKVNTMNCGEYISNNIEDFG